MVSTYFSDSLLLLYSLSFQAAARWTMNAPLLPLYDGAACAFEKEKKQTINNFKE